MSKNETLFQDKLRLPPRYKKQLLGSLKRHHTTFSLSEEERGETGLIELDRHLRANVQGECHLQ